MCDCDFLKKAIIIHPGLEIRYDSKYENHLYTKVAIPKGTLILMEKSICKRYTKFEECKAPKNNYSNPKCDDIKKVCDLMYLYQDPHMYTLFYNYPQWTRALFAKQHGCSFECKLFCYASFFSHDCNPNCTKALLGDFIGVYTNSKIKRNQMLTIHYGGSHTKECTFNCKVHKKSNYKQIFDALVNSEEKAIIKLHHLIQKLINVSY